MAYIDEQAMIKHDTPHLELPEDVRKEIEQYATGLSEQFQKDMNTPHPDDPSVPLRPPTVANYREARAKIQAFRMSVINRWNAEHQGSEKRLDG
jgi:hypothetical protein